MEPEFWYFHLEPLIAALRSGLDPVIGGYHLSTLIILSPLFPITLLLWLIYMKRHMTPEHYTFKLDPKVLRTSFFLLVSLASWFFLLGLSFVATAASCITYLGAARVHGFKIFKHPFLRVEYYVGRDSKCVGYVYTTLCPPCERVRPVKPVVSETVDKVMSSPFFQIDGFQDPASPGAFGIIDFHHDLMFLLTIIVIFVLWLVVQTIWKFYLPEVVGVDKRFQLISGLRQHNVPLEIVWTIVPALVLVVVAFPSFALLYSLDELVNPLFTLRTVGHQWYWSYEYAFFTSIGKHPGKLLGRVDFAAFQQADKDLNYVAPRPHLGRAEGLRRIHGGGWKFLWALSRFETFFESDGVTKPIWIHYTKLYDSNMILSNDLHSGEYRLLEVNRKVYLPFFVNIRGLITAADVLHSWAVPALGVKVDACPGRLNQVSINLLKFGVFYGQCSEICGTNHAFMPIVVKVMRIEQFLDWFRVFYFNYLI